MVYSTNTHGIYSRVLHGVYPQEDTTVWPKFTIAEVMQLAKAGDIEALCGLSARVYQYLRDKHGNVKSWASKVPTWASREHSRGLVAWGETRKKVDEKWVIIQKKNCIVELCRHPILRALTFWFQAVGVIPCQAGKSLKKSMKNPEYDPDQHARVNRRGQTRKQMKLVPRIPPLGPRINYLEPFLFVTGCAYMTYIRPQVEDGTSSVQAILGFLMERKVRTKMLANFKSRINRITNKAFISNNAVSLYAWVREGDPETRMRCLRALGDPGDLDLPVDGEPIQTSSQLIRQMSFAITATLVNVSCGRGGTEENEYGYFPYGKKAAESSDAFCTLPDAFFTMTLAEIYPFVARDRSAWGKMLKVCNHKMTGLWPWGKLNRHMQFRKQFRINRVDLFKGYEEAGGEFHGREPDAHVKRRKRKAKKKSTTVDAADDDSTSDTDIDDSFNV